MLLYEFVTGGSVPYANFSNNEVRTKVSNATALLMPRPLCATPTIGDRGVSSLRTPLLFGGILCLDDEVLVCHTRNTPLIPGNTIAPP